MTDALISDEHVLKLARKRFLWGLGAEFSGGQSEVLAFARDILAEHEGQRVHVPEPLEVMARAVLMEQGDGA